MGKYSKFIIAILGAALAAGSVFFGLDLETKGITAESIMGMAIPILTALGVWGVPNA